MYAFEIIDKMINAILRNECKHPHINQFNSGNHCPDCGQKIKISWITIRCQQCKVLRMPKSNNYYEIVPLDKYCTNCGSERWFSNHSEKLDVSEYMYGISLKEVVEGENASVQSKTDVWVEQADKSGAKRFSNVIKASRKFK
ncbi:MAG: hypothetical protein PHC34_11010 [Candidatus Gastranaerophilales bacterium]|nr:hypothetical protein [Candidatus Gastranaerophilales bacterium]